MCLVLMFLLTHFLSDKILYELNTSAFLGLVPNCDDCFEQKTDYCDEPMALSSKGYRCNPKDRDAVVFWDKCAGSYFCLYTYGIIEYPIYQLLRWFMERGYHRSPYLCFGAERIYSEFFRIHSLDMPGKLYEAKMYEEQRRKNQMKEMRRR